MRWHDAHEMRERFLDRGEVVENIGVIELEIVDDDELGQVVDEFAALVEEGRVVLVALDDPERAALPHAALGQILRQAADQVRRLAARRLEDPRQQRGRRRLAVRAGDDDVVRLAQEIGLQRFW